MKKLFSKYLRIQGNILRLARYNMKIVFGGKFIYFVLGAFGFFLLVGIIMAVDEPNLEVEEMYGLLVFPAILLVFYPSVYGIQNDADQRTLEIIFGIPDYRYKVWLVRMLMVLVIVFVLLLGFAVLTYYAMISIPIMRIVLHLMVLVFFTMSLGFCLSTIVKNGNAAAVIMVIFGLVFLILLDAIDESKWNIFLNPFLERRSLNEVVFRETVRQNRIIMLITSTVLMLIGLLNLQQREKFLR
jgi:hypothetical protein